MKNLKKKTAKKTVHTISIVYFLQTSFFTENTDCVFPRMNTIASRDQFKPIRIGEL